jgi:hypothetical protein
MMNFFERRKVLLNTNLLDLIPIRKQDHETTDDGKVNIIVQKFRNKFWSNFCVPKSRRPFFKVKLDEIGSVTWLSIDGQKNVHELCTELEQKLGERITPVEKRLSKFITRLYEQRYITFKQIENEKI